MLEIAVGSLVLKGRSSEPKILYIIRYTPECSRPSKRMPMCLSASVTPFFGWKPWNSLHMRYFEERVNTPVRPRSAGCPLQKTTHSKEKAQ